MLPIGNGAELPIFANNAPANSWGSGDPLARRCRNEPAEIASSPGSSDNVMRPLVVKLTRSPLRTDSGVATHVVFAGTRNAPVGTGSTAAGKLTAAVVPP